MTFAVPGFQMSQYINNLFSTTISVNNIASLLPLVEEYATIVTMSTIIVTGQLLLPHSTTTQALISHIIYYHLMTASSYEGSCETCLTIFCCLTV